MCGLRNSELSTCLSQFSHKTLQTTLLYSYFTPKVDFKRKFNHHQSFLYERRLTERTIRKFRFENFESDHQYESNLESDVRFEIESRSFAGLYHPPRKWIAHTLQLPKPTAYYHSKKQVIPETSWKCVHKQNADQLGLVAVHR